MLDAHNCNLHTLYTAITKKKPRAISDKAKLKALLRDVKPAKRKPLMDKLVELEQAGALTQDNYRKALAKKLGLKQIDDKLAQQITEKANQIRGTKDERTRTVLSAELAALIQKAVPSPLGRKFATAQTLGQLLNAKTMFRNIVGNGLFTLADTTSNGLGALIDVGVSKITGQRSRVLPQLGNAAKDFKEGAVSGYHEAVKGIDTTGGGTKFDLKQGFTFENPVGQGLEKVMGVGLKAPDRAFYQMARNESILNQMKASGAKEITPEMMAAAHEEALYKTFQDDSAAARVLTGIKQKLNIIGIKDFGLGDFVLKYPKTPGNLLSRAFAYSPTGFLKSVHEVAKPFYGAKPEFNQRAFVDSLSRATTGTVGIGAFGWMMGKLGIISGQSTSDKDIRSVETLQGMRPYSVNASAFMRFASSYNPQAAKPQKGDMIFSYDWAQPLAVPLAAAVNAANSTNPDPKGKAISAVEAAGKATLEATDTLTNQSVVQGLEQLLNKNKSIPERVIDTVSDAPASFAPTFLNQINQAVDNKMRSTDAPSFLDETINKVKAKVPGLAQTLPERKNVYGNTQERYQDGSNNVFNVFANPAFVSTLKSDPTGNEVIRLFSDSGEKQQAPRLVQKKVKIHQNGHDQNIVLKPEQVAKYQEYVGQKTKAIFDRVIQTKAYKRLDDEHRAKALAGIMTEVNTAAKMDLFGHKPTKRQSFLTRAVRMDNTPLALNQVQIKLRKAYITQVRQIRGR